MLEADFLEELESERRIVPLGFTRPVSWTRPPFARTAFFFYRIVVAALSVCFVAVKSRRETGLANAPVDCPLEERHTSFSSMIDGPKPQPLSVLFFFPPRHPGPSPICPGSLHFPRVLHPRLRHNLYLVPALGLSGL